MTAAMYGASIYDVCETPLPTHPPSTFGTNFTTNSRNLPCFICYSVTLERGRHMWVPRRRRAATSDDMRFVRGRKIYRESKRKEGLTYNFIRYMKSW